MTEQERIRDAYRSYEEDGRERLWDRGNRGFDRLSRDRDARIRELLARSIPPGPASLLDVGCGDGSLLAMVAGRWPDVGVAGLDLLAPRIDEAKARIPAATLVVGSADELPFDDASFDVVSAITLMSSIPSDEMEVGAAREIARVLRPGGWLVWYDLRYDNPTNPAVHGIGLRRLAGLFPAWTNELRSSTVLPPLARRLGRATPVAYPLLELVPPLRSHLIGRLRCPS